MTSTPVRPRCCTCQRIVSPGIVATSWNIVARWFALISANCEPCGTGTPWNGERQISMRLSVALVSQPGTADSSTDDQLLAAMVGVSNDPFSSATGEQALGLITDCP